MKSKINTHNIVVCCTISLIILLNSVSSAFIGTRIIETKKTDSRLNIFEKQTYKHINDIFKISEIVEKSFPAISKTKVKIYSFEGEITVKSENTSVVKMKATKMAVDKDASDGVKYDFSERNGVINLQADFVDSDRKIPYGKHYFYAKGAYVNWEVSVPQETDLILETDEGKIHVVNVSGEIKLFSKDGNITVKDCKGKLNSTTLDGKVQITGYQGSAKVINQGNDSVLVEGDFQDLSVLAGGGSVFLGLAKTSGGTVETDAKNLSIKDFVFNQLEQNDEGLKNYSFGYGNSNYQIKSNTGKVSIYQY